MAWVTWRQHRLALAGVGSLLSAAAVYLLLAGLGMHHAYAAVTTCHPAASDVCQRVINDFSKAYASRAHLTAALFQFIPALIGAFVGAPVLAREFETGTFRFAWTQGFGRGRWTLAKLIPLAVALTGAVAAFSLLVSWYAAPMVDARAHLYSPLFPTLFDLRELALPAWTLAAFAIGAFAGILIRRVIAAMLATLAAYAALAMATGTYLRAHYQAPLTTTNPNFAPPDWLISQSLTRNGQPASLAAINHTLRPVGIRAVTPDIFEPAPGPATSDNFNVIQYLAHHGITQVTTYQPAGRFWPFQWIEAGWLVALAVLLITATVWRVRHRAT
jgi:ABC-type transport system involved in multi-copper enzyme maturation permease subunit